MSKKDIQRITSDTEIEIQSLDEGKSGSNYSGNSDFNSQSSFWTKIRYDIISVAIIRLVIIMVTSITLMELERTL